jgi:hypothetical protein
MPLPMDLHRRLLLEVYNRTRRAEPDAPEAAVLVQLQQKRREPFLFPVITSPGRTRSGA